MEHTIKAHELGEEHVGAEVEIRLRGKVDALGKSLFHDRTEVRLEDFEYDIPEDAEVTILSPPPIVHPPEPTGNQAVVLVESARGRPHARFRRDDGTWAAEYRGAFRWAALTQHALTPIRVIFEGIPDTTSVVEPGDVVTEWPEDDEHLREWELLDSDMRQEPSRWRYRKRAWRFLRSDGRWSERSFNKPIAGPWTVVRWVGS